jgi:hypothetical protein
MPLTQPTYRLAIDDLTNEHEVAILPGDQLRAETEGNRRGLVDAKRQGQLLTFLWLWSACRRLGLVDKDHKFEPFVDRLVAWEPVKDEAGEPDVVEVPPTPEAGSLTSASPSQPGSPESTGSEQPSTIPLS